MAGMCLTREEKKKKKKKLATETRGSGDPPLDNITARRCQRPMLEETERYRETRREERDETREKASAGARRMEPMLLSTTA